jgi:hypothetical protein
VDNAAIIHSNLEVCSRIAQDYLQFKWTSVHYISGINDFKRSVTLGTQNILPTFNPDAKYYTAGFILPCDQVHPLLMEAIYLTK